jgi:hypothetical protein
MEVSPRLQYLVEYFAKAEPQTINKLAFKHGYFPPQSLEGRAGFLYEFLMMHGDEGLKELMRFHPDKDAMLSADGSNNIELKDTIMPTTILPPTKKEDSTRAIFFVGFIIMMYLILSK